MREGTFIEHGRGLHICAQACGPRTTNHGPRTQYAPTKRRTTSGIVKATRKTYVSAVNGVACLAREQYDRAQKQFDELVREHAVCDQLHRAAQQDYQPRRHGCLVTNVAMPYQAEPASRHHPFDKLSDVWDAVNEMLRSSTALSDKANEMHEMSKTVSSKADVCLGRRVSCAKIGARWPLRTDQQPALDPFWVG